MNDNEKEKPKNPALFNVESFNKAVASRDEIIAENKTTISALEEQIGSQQTVISELMKKHKSEESARIAAESELAQKKELKVEHKGNYFRTEEEKFADAFEKD